VTIRASPSPSAGQSDARCVQRSHAAHGKVDASLTAARIIGMPYPSYFHAPNASDTQPPWLRSRDVDTQEGGPYQHCFVGKSRRTYDFGEMLMPLRESLTEQCRRHVRCQLAEWTGAPELVQAYSRATFCLQPSGDTATRKGVFDAILVGCIPVVFDKQQLHGQYEMHMPAPEEVSVEVPEEHHGTCLEWLDNIPRAKVLQLQASIARSAPRLQYATHAPSPQTHPDAVDTLLEGLLSNIPGSHNQAPVDECSLSEHN